MSQLCSPISPVGLGTYVDSLALAHIRSSSPGGAEERIVQVAQMAIHEPPTIEVHTRESRERGGKGYVALVIPASPRAPHMVVVDDDNCSPDPLTIEFFEMPIADA